MTGLDFSIILASLSFLATAIREIVRLTRSLSELERRLESRIEQLRDQQHITDRAVDRLTVRIEDLIDSISKNQSGVS